MIRAVLFDLDGTLVDSRIDLADAVNEALRKNGLSCQASDDITQHVGNGMRVLLSSVMGPVPDEVLENGIRVFRDYYAKHCLDRTVLYEGVAESLRELPRDLKLGVVTNKPVAFTERILSGLGIRAYFGTVVGGDTLEERKPHPAPLLKALEDLGAESGHAVIIGDGTQDVRCGQAAGTLTCAAKYGFGFKPEVLELRPDFSINTFREIKEIVS